MQKPEPKIEIKSIRHNFTAEERSDLGGILARAVGSLRGIESEFDQVKAGYKAKTTAAEAQYQHVGSERIRHAQRALSRRVPAKGSREGFRTAAEGVIEAHKERAE